MRIRIRREPSHLARSLLRKAPDHAGDALRHVAEGDGREVGRHVDVARLAGLLGARLELLAEPLHACSGCGCGMYSEGNRERIVRTPDQAHGTSPHTPETVIKNEIPLTASTNDK